jgi:hypothetical protein
MNSRKYTINDIPEEIIDPENKNPALGQESPAVKPKLDDTLPSILNLSSEMSSMRKSKNDSYCIMENIKLNKNILPPNLSSLNKSSHFAPGHMKALSNEVFTNQKMLNFLNHTQGKENNHRDDEDDSSYYNYGSELNFEGGIENLWGENEEDIKKKLFIGDEIKNVKDTEEDEHEGLNILNMLQKAKEKNNGK